MSDSCRSLKTTQDKMTNILKTTMKFEAEHEECLRVLPYTESGHVVVQLYVFSGESGIPDNLKVAAQKCFGEMEVKLKWLDLYNDAANILNVTRVEYPSGEPKMLEASQVDEINEIISKNLHVFDEHRNITAVQASFKVVQSKQTEDPCIVIYVLGKGSIPFGESEFPRTIGPYPVDVVEGFWVRTRDPWMPMEAQEQSNVLCLGASIGVKGKEASGTLGAIVEDEHSGTLYALSCSHVMTHAEKSEIIHPGLNDHLNYLKYHLNEYSKWLDRITEPDCLEARFAVERLGEVEMAEKFEEMKTIKEKHLDSERCTKEILMKINKHEGAFETGLKPPRVIGNYIAGVSHGVKWQNDGKEYYVDGSIAKLTVNEVKRLRESRTVQVIGTGDYPSGECSPATTKAIMSAEELCKSGRTTGYTTSDCLVGATVDPPMFMKPPKFRTGGGALIDVGMGDDFCKNCAERQQTQSQLENIQEPGRFCHDCKEGRATLHESLWLKNCLCIRSGRFPFADEGDSGAVIFERHGNGSACLRGFGVIFAVHYAAFKFYAIASPLEVVLQALSQEILKDKTCSLRLVSNYA